MTHYQIICFVWFTTFAVPISIVFMHLRIIELPFFLSNKSNSGYTYSYPFSSSLFNQDFLSVHFLCNFGHCYFLGPLQTMGQLSQCVTYSIMIM